jgi:hypothetical protein
MFLVLSIQMKKTSIFINFCSVGLNIMKPTSFNAPGLIDSFQWYQKCDGGTMIWEILAWQTNYLP